MPSLQFRDLAGHADLARVVTLEKQIWGYTDAEDVVPAPILAVSVKRGGILVGAFDDAEMVGFVYSMPGFRSGQPVQWSHMLGVLERYRGGGTGRQLKLEQRQRALVSGFDLIEWTFDPLQAVNAHLNFLRLGVIVEEYVENMYGDSSSPLHRGVSTDRFIAQWWIREPRVTERVDSNRSRSAGESLYKAPSVITTRIGDGRLECISADLNMDAPRLAVEIPLGFTKILEQAPRLAAEWRSMTARVFKTYLARKYRVTDFLLDSEHGRGFYLLDANVAQPARPEEVPNDHGTLTERTGTITNEKQHDF